MIHWPKRRTVLRIAMVMLAILLAGFLLPERAVIPVQGATPADWNPKTFWFEPWGKSGVHKGIDIFARHGTPVHASVYGMVVYQGQWGSGGNVIAILGPKWRVHYYAHLAQPTRAPLFVAPGEAIAHVGDSGNAAGKAPHLHYSVLSLVPLPWRMRFVTQGWKRMFFLNPAEVLNP